MIAKYGICFTDFSEDSLFDLLEEEVAKEMSTDYVEVINVFLAKNPKSQCFGMMIVQCKFRSPFTYKGTEFEYFELMANVHMPNQKSPKLSNKINNLIVQKTVSYGYDEEYLYLEDDKNVRCFANKAFWDYTSTRTLENENLIIRLLMEQIISVSRKRNFIGEIKKFDKEHLKYFK